MVLRIYIEIPDFSILLIIKYKPQKNANIANFVYYGKTLMITIALNSQT